MITSIPQKPHSLPIPVPELQAKSDQLLRLIQAEIDAAGKPISFERYMELVLYTPELGYYASRLPKFGVQGDFVTAPEISALFSQCLAKQCQQVLRVLPNASILELGAGTGRMAADLLQALEPEQLPQHYYIFEISQELKQRQQQTLKACLPSYYPNIQWLTQLPENFHGVILANEVIDALPIARFTINKEQTIQEYLIDYDANGLIACLKTPITAGLSSAVEALRVQWLSEIHDTYHSEIQLALPRWLGGLSQCLSQGLILLLDYGFPEHEFYHPQRNQGTLMCHYQHRTHSDPLLLPGLQDITAHVDFTAVARHAYAQGLAIDGYTSQASFLLNCGIIDLIVQQQDQLSPKQQVQLNHQLQLLTSPAEMGELVKVMALTKGIDDLELLGFSAYDRRNRL